MFVEFVIRIGRPAVYLAYSMCS